MIEENIYKLANDIDELNRKVDFICSTLSQVYMVFAGHRAIKQFEYEEDANKWVGQQFNKNGKINNKSIIRSYWGIPRIESVANGLYTPLEG